MKKQQRHWTTADFVVTHDEIKDYGGGTTRRYRGGYCRIDHADMQQFGEEEPRHYNSHETARRLGLWGKRSRAA